MSRWMLHRIGLINFWYYDEEEFDFADGKLLLRGSNGSGKSVTMQSFIPLVLDGNKSPERLDPFGSRARRLEDYLLGEEGDRGYEERTGYLYMELKRESKDQFLTIGMGLKARRRKPLDFWGFSITDGRRIGHDISLYRQEASLNDGRPARIPLSKREIKDLVGEGGTVTDSQKEYMELVNRLVFGFDTVEEYDDLIKLLIQLRSPKLSKEFKPTVIYNIMNSSLPALSDEDLRPLTETIENMDQIKIQLDQLMRNQKAVSKLKEEYDRYNRLVLYERAKALKIGQGEQADIHRRIKELENKLEKDCLEIERLAGVISALENESDALKAKERQYREHDAYKLEQQWVEQEQLLKELEINATHKAANLRDKQNREWKLKGELEEFEIRIGGLQDQIKGVLEEMDDLADDIRFHDHEYDKVELERVGEKPFDFSAWHKDAILYHQKLKEGRLALEAQDEANRHYDILLKEQDKLSKQRDAAAKQETRAIELMDQARRDFMAAVQSWIKENKLFRISEQEQVALNQIILKYGEGKDFSSIQEALHNLYQPLVQEINRRIVDLEHRRDQLKEETRDLMQQLEEWKQKKDPEPVRDEQVIDYRKRLKDAGIPFAPLYQAVEFQPELSEEQRGNLEAALEDMGLLDALIIPQKYMEQAMDLLENGCDKIVIPSPKLMTTNLTQFIKGVPVDGCDVPLADIEDALCSILAYREGQSFYIDEHGNYGMGIVTGKARDNVVSRYIGAESRRRYRERVIEELENQLDELRQEMEKVRERLSKLNGDMAQLEEERRNFPKPEDLDAALELWQQAVRELRFLEGKLIEHDKMVAQQLKVVQEKKAEVYQKTKSIDLPKTIQAFVRAEEGMEQYREVLHELDRKHHSWVSENRMAASKREQYQETLDDVDLLKGELNEVKRKIEGCRRLLSELDELRHKPEYLEIQQEINRCIQRMEEIPKEIKEAVDKRARLEQALINRRENLESAQEERNRLDQRVELLWKGFVDEYNLGFVVLEEAEGGKYTLDEMPSIILKSWKSLIEKWNTDKIALGERLQKTTYEVLPELTEYGVSMDVLFDVQLREEDPLADIRGDFRRYVLTARLEGRQVSIYKLDKWIDDEISIHENLLKETDRQLFEEIIMQTVGRKIRAKIYRAEEWVKNMNRLMAQRDTSSGLTFYLQWKPKTAESEEQLDTRELVDILRTDANILRMEDFNRVTEHFRSQVDRAKRMLDDGAYGQTFHQIIRDVLDYRQWFEFVLYYQKEGESRRELTNRAFDRLSGGEKAMAMYIPLFSSVYARYQSAGEQAPRLISLDEAFAGVDENNIRDMFQLTEELGFNYIMNSQILWGDYDTVNRLSICELVRPKNADFVTVIRYLWDGQCKRLIMDDERDEVVAAM